MQAQSKDPYGSTWSTYADYGWSVLHLPLGEKSPPPEHTTGRFSDPALSVFQTWANSPGNIGLRLPEGVVGIDVDAYGGKAGRETLEALETVLGALPATWTATSRDDGVSGIRFYQVRIGLEWPGQLGPGIDVIRHDHRYAVVAPSIHPSGRPYQWFNPLGQQAPVSALCPPDGLPWLPETWVEHITRLQLKRAPEERIDGAVVVLREGRPCRAIQQLYSTHQARLSQAGRGGRHDAMVRGTQALVTAGMSHEGGAQVLQWFHRDFVNMIGVHDASSRGLQGEWDRAVRGAHENAAKNPTEICRGAECGQAMSIAHLFVAPEPDPVEVFWSSSETRAKIKEEAWARNLNPWGLLCSTLARVSGELDWRVQIPGPPAAAPLNMFVALVGGPGSGKTATMSVSSELMGESRCYWRNAGTGEGLVAMYGRPTSKTEQAQGMGDFIQTVTQAGLEVDELGSLAGLFERRGQTLADTLKTAWAGGRLGQANAMVETRRNIDPRRYRFSFITGVLLKHAHIILDDADGGLPQRFLWAGMNMGADDWNHAANQDFDPKPFEWPKPAWCAPADEGMLPRLVRLPAYIRSAVAEAQRESRLGINELAGHRAQLRVRTAVLLGVMDGHIDPTEADWEASATLMAYSDSVLDNLVERSRVVSLEGRRAKVVEETVFRAQANLKVTDVVETIQVEKAADRLLKVLEAKQEDPTLGVRPGVAKTAITRSLQPHFDEALDLLETRGLVRRVSEGKRHRIVLVQGSS